MGAISSSPSLRLLSERPGERNGKRTMRTLCTGVTEQIDLYAPRSEIREQRNVYSTMSREPECEISDEAEMFSFELTFRSTIRELIKRSCT